MKPIYLSVISEIQEHLEEMKSETLLFELSSDSTLDYFHTKPLRTPKKITQTNASAWIHQPQKKEISQEKKPPAPLPDEKPITPEKKELPPIKEKPYSEALTKPQISSSLHKEITHTIPTESLDNVRRTLQKTAPHITLFSDLPNDAHAKDKRFEWKKPCVTEPFIIFSTSTSSDSLLKNLSQAITTRFAPCRLLTLSTFVKAEELQDCLHSSSIKLILTLSDALQSEPFRSLYKEIHQKNYQGLGDIPLFMLGDTIHSLQDGAYKKRLWEKLCQTLPNYLK